MVIVETSTTLPHVCGDDTGIHSSEVDYIVEGDNAPIAELANPASTAIDSAVARRIIGEIEDGACLQIGIGGMPNAVCGLLANAGITDLGVHTEVMTDGIAELYRAGRSPARARRSIRARSSTLSPPDRTRFTIPSTATRTCCAARSITPTRRT